MSSKDKDINEDVFTDVITRVDTSFEDDFEYIKDEEDENVRLIANQINIEQRMEDLYWNLKEYVEIAVIPLCEKLRVNHLTELLYPNLKRLY